MHVLLLAEYTQTYIGPRVGVSPVYGALQRQLLRCAVWPYGGQVFRPEGWNTK